MCGFMDDKELILTEDNPLQRLGLSHRRYVEARLQGLTQGASAKVAGVKNGTHMERHPGVRAALKWAITESFGNVEDIGKNDVLQGMKDAVESAATSGELVMAWREIGKLIGAYEPERKILEVHDYTKEELKALKDEDLLRMAGGRMQDALEGEFHEVSSKTPEPAEIEESG